MKKTLLIFLTLLVATMFAFASCDETSFSDSSFEQVENNSPKDTTNNNSISISPGNSSNKEDKNDSDSTTSKKQEASTPEETTPKKPDKTPSNDEKVTMVWIPKTGSKYHSNSTCSNMKSPKQVTLETAKKQGYTACKRCH
ncbi:MAG: hypothetical protein E7630_05605 [Ruminococcaceae bacterium]|nr:hypothetical protein [Oscillospiraceae bacterium]